MKSLRIILVLPDSPLPFENASSRLYYPLLKGLAERGHKVSSFVACRSAEDTRAIKAVFTPAKYDIRCYIVSKQRFLGKFKTLLRPRSYTYSAELQRDLQKELRNNYDVLHLEHTWSGWLGLRQTNKTILNVHYLYSIDSSLYKPFTLIDSLRHWIILKGEKRLIKHYPHILTISERLAREIKSMSPNAFVATIPFPLDLSLYTFNQKKPMVDFPSIGLVGSFDWLPTLNAAERLLKKLWPKMKEQIPDLKLRLVGRSANKIIDYFGNLEGVEINEDVKDIEFYFNNIDVMVYVPTAASGVKVKVLEAFAFGTAIVTNSEGVEGISAVDGMHAGICDDDNGIIERTINLLNNPDLRKKQCFEARKLIEEKHNPKATVDELENIYRKIF